MVEFGDELIIQSFKVPWLIWIQLVVTILLVMILFFGFVVFSSDSLNSSASASVAPASGASPPMVNCNGGSPSSSNRIAKMEGQRGRMDTGTSGGSTEQEDQSEEESVPSRIFRHPIHPCNYIGLARRALFKCFGLDSTPESNRNRKHEKQE